MHTEKECEGKDYELRVTQSYVMLLEDEREEDLFYNDLLSEMSMMKCKRRSIRMNLKKIKRIDGKSN